MATELGTLAPWGPSVPGGQLRTDSPQQYLSHVPQLKTVGCDALRVACGQYTNLSAYPLDLALESLGTVPGHRWGWEGHGDPGISPDPARWCFLLL